MAEAISTVPKRHFCHALETSLPTSRVAFRCDGYQNASMPNVLIRDLPDDIHARLQERAEAAGQSLQQYLTQELTKVAAVPSMEELLIRIGARAGGTVGFDEAVADLARERSER